MNEIGKTQQIRLLDVFFIGPFMVWFAANAEAPQWAKVSMAVLGVLTMLYNGAHFLRQEAANGA